MNKENNSIYIFESFQVDPARRRLLRRDGELVPIHSKTFDLLLALIENRGRIIEKDELLGLVWANQIVEEGNLTVKMSALRKALGERKDEARFIVTVPGRGYRFVADVRQVDPRDGELVVEHHAVTRIVVEEETEADLTIPTSAERRNDWRDLAGRTAASATTVSRSAEIDSEEDSSPPPAHVSLVGKVKSGSGARITVIAAAAVVVVVAVAGYWFGQSRNSKNASAPLSFQQPALRRLTTSGKLAAAAISPDGKYFVFAQREAGGQSLWVRQIAESRSVRIMPAEPVEYWGLTFAPDSTHVYCTIFTGRKADPELRRVPVLGGAIERLPTIACGAIAFAPDGRHFAYVVPNSARGGVLLRIADADGANDRVLATLKYPSYFVFPDKTLSWSPDGETIACAAKIVGEAGDYGTVLSVRVSDGSMTPLPARRFPWVESVAWLADGAGLLITANETAGAPLQIWHLSFPDGATRKITNDLNTYNSASVTADGKLLLAAQRTTASSLRVADYVAASASVQVAGEAGDYGEIAWTPDKKIVYRSSASGSPNLWAMDADGKNQTQLTKDGLPDKGLAISPDGRYIVFSSFGAGKYNLWRANADGSSPVQLTDGAGEVYPRITPDGAWVIYQQGTGQTDCTLWRMPIEGGARQQITRTHTVFPALAPDGERVLYFYMDKENGRESRWRIGVARVEDGKQIFAFDAPEKIIGRVARWTPGGQAIVYARAEAAGSELWRQTLDDAPPAFLMRFADEQVENFAWSPDGERLAVALSSRVDDAVLIQDFR